MICGYLGYSVYRCLRFRCIFKLPHQHPYPKAKKDLLRGLGLNMDRVVSRCLLLQYCKKAIRWHRLRCPRIRNLWNEATIITCRLLDKMEQKWGDKRWNNKRCRSENCNLSWQPDMDS